MIDGGWCSNLAGFPLTKRVFRLGLREQHVLNVALEDDCGSLERRWMPWRPLVLTSSVKARFRQPASTSIIHAPDYRLPRRGAAFPPSATMLGFTSCKSQSNAIPIERQFEVNSLNTVFHRLKTDCATIFRIFAADCALPAFSKTSLLNRPLCALISRFDAKTLALES